ncbi:glycosyltransferase [Nocardioides bigeumensis]|uniref:Glycosyltransferase n=1 Tax=Nocardioides bigeumensis TaxID=433657 RepID=A0ABN2YFP2_9ACTN
MTGVKVLFTSCPAYGHALPMLPLIRAAMAAGADVRVATGPDLVDPLRDRGLDARPAGPPWTESWAEHNRIWADPGHPGDKMLDGVIALFGSPAGRRLDDLTAMARDWRPDLVVHEVLELGGSILAGRLGVRSVVHGFGPMFPFYAHLAGPAGAAAGDDDLWATLSQETYLDICPPALRPDGPPAWTASLPLRPSSGERGPVSPDVAELLRRERSLAYFTLGTVKNEDAADLATGLAGLAEYDGHVLATTGRPVDPDELGPLPANVTLAAFVPQGSVLPHADLVVSHSGSGTMLGAFRHGLAQVAVPRGTDQPENAALMARTGAGVVVPPENYTVEAVRAAVETVTSGPEWFAAAQRVRDEIDVLPDADEVWSNLSG